ncbi:MAG TPA: SRPBCC domain-containing protein [Polyangiales bacterium]|nr:SRPBCC domain-containing protein [Polyangiales bacterium]
MSSDVARVTVAVEVPPDAAFRIFTEEIDQWWLRGLRYRALGGARSLVYLEPRQGGRLFEQLGEQVVQTGEVTVWEPPSRLCFIWRGANLRAPDQTQVEVLFTARGEGTLVTLTHSGWNRIPSDHPVRHGQDDRAFLRRLGLWWGELLSSLRERAQL